MNLLFFLPVSIRHIRFCTSGTWHAGDHHFAKHPEGVRSGGSRNERTNSLYIYIYIHIFIVNQRRIPSLPFLTQRPHVKS